MSAVPTVRQRDHWVNRGYLHPEGAGGRGDPWRWPAEELRVADLMGRLVVAGLHVETAHRVARACAWASTLRPETTNVHVVVLGEGVTIEVLT